MFKAEIKSEILKGMVNVISTLVDEVKFSIDSEGMKMRAIDPAHVAMIELNIGEKAFESYSASETEIGLDLDKVKTVLKLAGPGDMIVMEQEEGQGKLIFKIGNITRSMNLVDTSTMGNLPSPQYTFSSSVGVVVDHLQRGIRASESISDYIALEVDSEGFELTCKGDTDAVSLRLDKSDLNNLSASTKVCSHFQIDYFSNMIKAIPSSTVVSMELDNDYPIKLSFHLANGEASVSYLLAARIEND